MFAINKSRTIYTSEMSFGFQKKFFSRFVCSSFSRWKAKNDFRRNVDFYILKLRPRFESFKTSNNVREHSTKILETWSQQLKFIIAHRIRRSFQMIVLYRKWWGDFATNLNVRRLTLDDIVRRLYLTICATPLFQWDEHRIKDEELSRLPDEFANTKLFSNQFAVKKDPTIPENAVAIENKCNCERCSHLSEDGWSLFYHGNNLFIWRKEHKNYKDQGLYVYKVWGSFSEVTASDFFRVQIDTDYRKEWDPNSIELKVIDSDPSSNSDILYWEFLFPTMFYNRDYVCNRRYEIDHEKKTMAVISQTIEHPDCPQRPPIHRVNEYWSHIVIKPTKDSFDEPGMEFTITYFDNPEVIIPSYISVWYTVNGMPDYIMKQKNAAIRLARRRYEAEQEEKENTRVVVNREPNNESQGRRILLM